MRSHSLTICSLLCAVSLSLGACGDDEPPAEDTGVVTGRDATAQNDAEPRDAGFEDATTVDTGVGSDAAPTTDAGSGDGGDQDSSTVDTGAIKDAGFQDVGVADSGPVGCATSFDCPNAAAPVCDRSSGSCVAAPSDCVGDDGAENGDDSPQGAPTVNGPTMGSPVTLSKSICGQPAYESDWVRLEIANTLHLRVSLTWQALDDLDIRLYDSVGAVVWSQGGNARPKGATFESLLPGTYYVRVVRSSGATAPTEVTPYVLTFEEVECASFFNCTSPSLPVCTDGVCVAGQNSCDPPEDDLREDADDGPAGAVEITAPVGVPTSRTGHICNDPDGELDSFFVATDASNNLEISLSWASAAVDLDLYVYLRTVPQTETLLGTSYLSSPEVVRLTNLPAGQVVIIIDYYGSTTATTEPYTLDILKTAGGCLGIDDCAAEYQTQIFRGACQASGACTRIDGNGALPLSSSCDSDDDCVSGLCSYSLYEADAERSVCTIGCTQDAECSQLGLGFVCADASVFSPRRCVPACLTDVDCGTFALPPADPGLPWDYFTCDANSGVCTN